MVRRKMWVERSSWLLLLGLGCSSEMGASGGESQNGSSLEVPEGGSEANPTADGEGTPDESALVEGTESGSDEPQGAAQSEGPGDDLGFAGEAGGTEQNGSSEPSEGEQESPPAGEENPPVETGEENPPIETGEENPQGETEAGSPPGAGVVPIDCSTYEMPDGFVVVDSLSELVSYLDDDDVRVAMAPGTYRIRDSDGDSDLFPEPSLLIVEGSGSVYDFSCATIEVETEVMSAYGNTDFSELQIVGNENVVRNLTLTDIGDAAPAGRAHSVIMDGIENRIEGLHLTVRGSFPYGYGDAFGKGSGPVIGHHKHSAILIRGNGNHLLNSTVIHRAYGHGIFMQAARDAVIEGCYVEGEVRSTDDMLAEEGTGSPADDVDFMTDWGYRLPPGHVMSLQEEGIRAYNAGETFINGEEISRGSTNVTVLNNVIKHMRGGVTLTHAQGTKYVEGTSVIGCERGFAIGSGDIVSSSGDALYGPVLGFDYSSDRGANVDITLLSNEGAYNGSRAIAYIGGSDHDITIRSSETNVDSTLRVMLSGDNISVRHGQSNSNQDDLDSSNIVINNLTEYPLVLAPASSDISGLSNGPVEDAGDDNDIGSN